MSPWIFVSFSFLVHEPPPVLHLVLFLSLPLFPSGLTRDGDGSATAESLEEVLNILAEEGSDWIYGFFTFLQDVVSSPVQPVEPIEPGWEEEEEEEEDGTVSSSNKEEVNGVMLDLQNL